MTMQEYLIRKLEMVMPEEDNGIAYELEALKAQAVLRGQSCVGFFCSGGFD